MGNGCCSRDKQDEYKETAKQKFVTMKSNVGEKLKDAKVKYAPQIDQVKMRCEDARIKYKGFMVEEIDDKTVTGFITDFEHELPLKRIDIDEFERRLKKLAEPEYKDFLTSLQVQESFCDHVYLKEICKKDTLIRAIMLHDDFMDLKTRTFHIPTLLLLGNMYCASNSKARAQKFFELCQPELDQNIAANDKELKKYFLKMLEICFYFMIRLYDEHCQSEKSIPEEWMNYDKTKLQFAYEKVYEEFIDDIFVNETRKPSELFVSQLKSKQCYWLKPYFLRKHLYQNIVDPTNQ